MEKKEPSFSRRDIIAISILVALMGILLVISPYLPDERPGAIRKELQKQGYAVENIDFVFVKDGEGRQAWIFESSSPIYYEGHYISQWSLHSYSFSTPFVHYYVQPYPPLPEPVTVTIAFTQEEFERLTERLNGQPIEEYIKEIVLTDSDE